MKYYDSDNQQICDTESQQTVQQVNAKSAQNCGCDEGADWTCQACKDKQAAIAWGRNVLLHDAITSAASPVPAFISDAVDEAVAGAAGTCVGIGGAPTRATTLPTDATERKQYPVASGVLDYFPDALAAVANVSWSGSQQHNPGKPLFWDRSKSQDEEDTAMRHFLARGTLDTDGKRHTAKFAWRALAILQKEIEQEQK